MGILNKVMTASSVIDGAKNVKKTYNNSLNNKYSNILGTNVVNSKEKNYMGQNNAINMNKDTSKKELIASEEIDALCKVAGIKDIASQVAKKTREIDLNNTQHIKNTAKAIKNKQFGRALKEGAKASAVTVPAAGGMILAGKGFTKTLQKLDKRENQNERTDNQKKVMGGALTTALALNALANKRALVPFGNGAKQFTKATKNIVENNTTRAIGDQLRKSDTIHTVSQTIKNPVKKLGKKVQNNVKKNEQIARQAEFVAKQKNKKKILDDISNELSNKTVVQKGNNLILPKRVYGMNKNNERRKMEEISNMLQDDGTSISKLVGNARQNNSMNGLNINKPNYNKPNYNKPKYNKPKFNKRNRGNNGPNKKASEEIDDLLKIAGYPVELGKAFVKSGVNALPAMLAPAILSYAINRDLKTMQKLPDRPKKVKKAKSQKIKKTKQKEINKVAFQVPNINKTTVKNFALKHGKDAGMIAAKSLGSAVIPGAIVYATGRNIGGALEKVKTRDEINKEMIKNKEEQKKLIQDEVARQIQLKSASEKGSSDVTDDIGDVYNAVSDTLNKDIRGCKEVEKKKIHIGNGVKKTFRKE